MSHRLRNGSSVDELPYFFDNAHAGLADRARNFAMGQELAEGTHDEDPVSLAARCRALALALGREKLLGVCVPAAFGGALMGSRMDAVDVRSVCLLRETLGWASPLCEFVLAMQGLGSYPIALGGSDAQRARLLPAAMSGEQIMAFALTEPEAGTDAAALQSTAERVPGGYVLQGRKTFISNAGIADVYVVFVKTEPALGSRGITAFYVRPTDPGFVFEGAQTLVTDHPVGTLRFDRMPLAESRRIGAEGEGLRLAMRTLDTFRTTVGAAACGMARRALDESLHRALTRSQFGKPIGENQIIQSYLSEMATELDAARLLVYRAACAKDRGQERPAIDASMAKMFATEAAQRIVDRAVQIHGGTGVLRGVVVEKLYRDIRALRIYEGTTEIHLSIIAKVLMAAERARIEDSMETRSASRATIPEARRAPDTIASMAPPSMVTPLQTTAARASTASPTVPEMAAQKAKRRAKTDPSKS
ncbi:MAG: acyl-CoA dehydrogenase family protein [Deltaproteobacteria bacterium]|nr:acyl-CoA dehydrogenase family protein [Deltaproteobacteria bacterium]